MNPFMIKMQRIKFAVQQCRIQQQRLALNLHYRSTLVYE